MCPSSMSAQAELRESVVGVYQSAQPAHRGVKQGSDSTDLDAVRESVVRVYQSRPQHSRLS
jgi:hypothetical protein